MRALFLAFTSVAFMAVSGFAQSFPGEGGSGGGGFGGGEALQIFTIAESELCSAAQDPGLCYNEVTSNRDKTLFIDVGGQFSRCFSMQRRETESATLPLWRCSPRYGHRPECYTEWCIRLARLRFTILEAPEDKEDEWNTTNDPIRNAGYADNYCSANDDDIMEYDNAPFFGKKKNIFRHVTVDGGRIKVNPRSFTIPDFDIPNTVDALGWDEYSKSEHVYNVYVPAKPGIRLSSDEVFDKLRRDPTPGFDKPASNFGTRNDVGRLAGGLAGLAVGDDGTNYVKSFIYPAPNPK